MTINDTTETTSNIGGSLVGGASFWGNVTGNNVTVVGKTTTNGKNITKVNGAVLGGVAFNGSVLSNIVNLSGVNVTGETKELTFYRGNETKDGTLPDGKFSAGGSLIGGYSQNSSNQSAGLNQVVFVNGNLAGSVVGGYTTDGAAFNNTVKLDNVSKVGGNIYGGVAKNTTAVSYQMALNNTVTLSGVSTESGGNISSDGKIIATYGNVIGGFGMAASLNNSVTLDNKKGESKIAGSVAGGIAGGTAAQNNVTIAGNDSTKLIEVGSAVIGGAGV